MTKGELTDPREISIELLADKIHDDANDIIDWLHDDSNHSFTPFLEAGRRVLLNSNELWNAIVDWREAKTGGG